jgi:hypothetical protein
MTAGNFRRILDRPGFAKRGYNAVVVTLPDFAFCAGGAGPDLATEVAYVSFGNAAECVGCPNRDSDHPADLSKYSDYARRRSAFFG